MAFKEIGPGLFRITIDTGLFASNVYLIDRGLLTLIDTGPSHTVSALTEGLAQAGRSLAEVKRLFFTHIHWDHAGGAKAVSADLGGEMLCAAAARNTLAEYDTDLAQLISTREAFLSRTGVPGNTVQTILADLGHFGGFGESATPHGVFAPGQTFSLGQGRLTAVSTPGHTTQCVSFYLEDDGILFSGDFLMGRFSTYLTPHMNAEDGYLPLGAYCQSLHRARGFLLRCILPGHGPAIKKPADRISKILKSMPAYQEKVLRIIGREPQNHFQIFEKLNGAGNRWAISFGVAEVAAHLGVLLAEKKVRREDRHGVDYFWLN